MTELVRNQRVLKKAQTEVRRTVLQGNTTLNEAEIQELITYLKLIINESLRLHPPL
ncbi:hypothetical protein Sjap_002810 [Stephania japonica]|uniref:Cytochrome P450 n=1 Tax=Stephania japonica TaxID=461633 RepID=A0AAP0KNG7_9MAGN